MCFFEFEPYVEARDNWGGELITEVAPNTRFVVYHEVTATVLVTESYRILGQHYDQNNVLKDYYENSFIDQTGSHFSQGFIIDLHFDLETIEAGDYFIFKTINVCDVEAEWRVDVVDAAG